MPTLYGELPLDNASTKPCRWCGQPTDLTFAPDGSRIGPVPLHMLCGAGFIRAYRRMQADMALPDRDRQRLAAFGVPQLAEGHAAASSD